MSVLAASGLYRFFHIGDEETAALRGVDVVLTSGEFCVLQGPSGSGKSTLISCLAGLDVPDGGAVDLMGERLSRRSEADRGWLRARCIGLMMQSGNLFDHLSIRANMLLQIAMAGRGDFEGIDKLLAELGLANLGDMPPAQLSGGEAARAALAVALATDPDILICDEPTAEVDAVTERAIIDRLWESCQRGAAVLVATHSAALAARADRVIEIEDGRIVHV